MSDDLRIRVAPMQPDLKRDFYSIHCEARGTGWCFCAAWWLPTWEGWGERTEGQNRALREALFDDGQYDGYLLYVEKEPVGWCQCGPRDRLTKLCQAYALPADPHIWALTCFVIAPEYRGQGLAHRLLAEVLIDLANRGVKSVQAFPRRGGDLSPGEVWTGPEALFLRAGFTLARDDPRRPVYCKKLSGT